MLKKLKDKWKVSGGRLILILCTFAIGGSLCGIAGKKILTWLSLEQGALWVITYIIIVTLIWPLCVILVSIPFGQFLFFKQYIGKMLRRFKGQSHRNPVRLAIFASGKGSNAREIIRHFLPGKKVQVALIVSNKEDAGVLDIAKEHHIETLIISKKDLDDGSLIGALKQQHEIDWIILAGFLLKIPESFIEAWPRRIINIHPALLPAYGGKGMYGMRVHEAVMQNKETKSGVTIHYVDDQYDHGETIAQYTCDIADEETPGSLAEKIHQLEHQHFAPTIGKLIKSAK